MKKRFNFSTHVGASSVLLIFMVVSLVSFATLSMVNSSADNKLTHKLEEKNTAYYNAVHEANAYLAATDNMLSNGGSLVGESQTKSFEINESQSLVVTIVLNDNPKAYGKYYTVTQWQIVSEDTSDDYDVTLPVLK